MTKSRAGGLTVTPEAAQLERITRERARRRLQSFGEYVLPWWKPAAVHALICQELEGVYRYIETGGAEGTSSLIIEMPPQHGKTTIVSQLFPAWLLGKRPDSRVVLTAYIADLSQENSRSVRQLVTGDRYKAVFGEMSAVDAPVMLSEDSTSRANWGLAEPHRGGVLAVGVGGGMTGRPAELIVIDDPFKNREEAESQSERQRKLKWMTSSVLSRVRKGTAIVIIHTRWHREDLIGEMLKSMANNLGTMQWKVLSLPALPLEEGEYAQDEAEQRMAFLEGLYKPLADPLGRTAGSERPLWPEQFSAETLERIRKTLQETGQITDWYALYQQQPRPADGAFFSSADFLTVDHTPENLKWVRYVDLAISERKTADWNATVAEAVDSDGNLYLRDMIRVRGWDEFRERLVFAMVSEEERGTRWGLEKAGFQSLAFRELMRDPRLMNVAISEETPNGDKVSRARPLQTRAKAGKVKLVKGPWVQPFLMEMLDFPNGRHDDQVDTASGGLGMIANYYPKKAISRQG
jgi:predicted phage terminase large subunit-like protein